MSQGRATEAFDMKIMLSFVAALAVWAGAAVPASAQ